MAVITLRIWTNKEGIVVNEITLFLKIQANEISAEAEAKRKSHRGNN